MDGGITVLSIATVSAGVCAGASAGTSAGVCGGASVGASGAVCGGNSATTTGGVCGGASAGTSGGISAGASVFSAAMGAISEVSNTAAGSLNAIVSELVSRAELVGSDRSLLPKADESKNSPPPKLKS